MGSGVSSLRGNSKSREVEQPRKVEDVLSIPGRSNNRETNTSPDNFVINTSLNAHASEVERNDVEVNYYPNDTDDNTDRYLSNCFSQETPHQNSMQPPHSARSEYSEGDAAAAEMFAHTALSLGMDNDDLLFNLMYFNSDDNATFGTVMNSVQSETLALHSENNTPYKLKPASTSAISGLTRMNFGIDIAVSEIERLGLECDCAVCKDEIEDSAPILQIPSCQHFFHEECLLRWINLQGWCPVCRAPVEATAVLATAGLGQDTIEPIPEEGPTTHTDDWIAGENNDSAPVSPVTGPGPNSESRVSAMRLFEDENDVIAVPVRIVDTNMDHFPSQKYVSDGRIPGVKQCL